MVHAERDVVPEDEIYRVDPAIVQLDGMTGGAGEIDVGRPSPGPDEPLRARLEEIVVVHLLHVVPSLVPLVLGYGGKHELVEVDRGVAFAIDCRDSLEPRVVPPRRFGNLVSVEVHEPVAVEFSGELFLASQEPRPVVVTRVGVAHDAG